MKVERKVGFEEIVTRVKDNPATLIALGILLGAGGGTAAAYLLNRFWQGKVVDSRSHEEIEKLTKTELTAAERVSITKKFLEISLATYLDQNASSEGLSGLIAQARLIHGASQLSAIFPESLDGRDFLTDQTPEVRTAVRMLSISSSEIRTQFEQQNRQRLRKEGYEVFRLDGRGFAHQWGQIEQIMKKRWGYLPLAMERHGVKSFSNPNLDHTRMNVEHPENFLMITKKGKMAGFVNFNLFAGFPEENRLAKISFRQLKSEFENPDRKPSVLMLTSTTNGFEHQSAATGEIVSAAFYEVIDLSKRMGVERIYAPALSAEASLERFKTGRSYSEIFAEVDRDGFPRDSWRAALSLFGDLIETSGEPAINDEFMTYRVSRSEIVGLMSVDELKRTKEGKDFAAISSRDGKFVRLRSFRQGIFEKINDEEFKLSVGAGWIRIRVPPEVGAGRLGIH